MSSRRWNVRVRFEWLSLDYPRQRHLHHSVGRYLREISPALERLGNDGGEPR